MPDKMRWLNYIFYLSSQYQSCHEACCYQSLFKVSAGSRRFSSDTWYSYVLEWLPCFDLFVECPIHCLCLPLCLSQHSGYGKEYMVYPVLLYKQYKL